MSNGEKKPKPDEEKNGPRGNNQVLPESHTRPGIDISTNDMAMTSKVSERNQVFYDAVCSGDLITVQALVLQGVDLDWPGGDGNIRPLHQSACNGYLEIVKCLVEAGATVDCVDDEGFTPLIWASVMFEYDIAAYLVSKGASISWIPDDGKSAIMNAADSEGGQTLHMLMLAALGWDIGDPARTNGWTMLHRAVRDNLHHDNEVRMLVKKGDRDVIHKLAAASGGINVKDRLGLTPLHHAVRGRLVHEEEMWRDYDKGTWREADLMSNLVPTKANMALVTSLIASGSDLSDIDRYGHSVLWHAKYFGQDEVIHLLKGDEFAIPDQSKDNIKIAVDNGNEINEDKGIENNAFVDLLPKVSPHDSNATTWPRLALLELGDLMQRSGIGPKDRRTTAPEMNQLEKMHSNKSHEMVTWTSDVPSEAISLMAKGKMLPQLLNYLRQKTKNDEDLRAALHNRSSPPERPQGKPFAIKNILRSPAINPGFRNSRGVHEVHEQMDGLVQRLVEEMNDISPILKLRVVLGGSVSEKTKIGLPDEYDYRLYIGALDGKCSVVREIEYDLSVPLWQRRTISIKVSDDVSSSLSSYCDDSNVIDPAALFMHVHGVMYKALSRDIWEGIDMYWKPYGRNALHVQWMGNHWHGMAIKADIMYCVEIKNWWPTTVRQESHLLPNIKSNPCCVLLRPHSFQPSSCELERIVMSQLSEEMKTIYSIGKFINRLTDSTRKQDKVTSYDLKNALFYYLEMNAQTENFKSSENPKEIEGKMYSWGGSYGSDSESLPLMVKHLRSKTLQIFHDGLSLLREHRSYYFGISRWAEKEDEKIPKAKQQNKFEEMLQLFL